MKSIPTGSPSYKKRNPHLFGREIPPEDRIEFHGKWNFKVGELPKPPKRLRQNSKPLMNKLEMDWYNQLMLQSDGRGMLPHQQSVTFRLANGLRYTPDVFAFEWPAIGEALGPTAWEVKGPYAREDSMIKLKMFAATYPEIRVILVWKRVDVVGRGQWATQRILP